MPFWALAHVFGRDATYWYRLEQSLGRNSIVGTTVKNPELLPEDLAADEKHSRLKGEKVYVPVTVGAQCILGAAVSKDRRGNRLDRSLRKIRAGSSGPESRIQTEIRQYGRLESGQSMRGSPFSHGSSSFAAFCMCS